MNWLIEASIAFIITILLHSTLCRCYTQINRVFKFVIIFTPIWILLLLSLSNQYGIYSLELYAGILIYSFICELYLFLFTMILSSISANILYQLLNINMPLTTLIDMYDSNDMVKTRLDRLIVTGLLVQQENKFLLTPKAKLLMKVFGFAKNIFRHE